ncbi:MAG: ABC transporter permease subunit, partial [Marmoricola sp.]
MTRRSKPASRASSVSSRWISRLAVDKIGAVYVWLAIVVVFSFWAPETFPNLTTAKQILNANAITGLAALSVTIPLAARVFDLSFALTMTLCGVAVTHFIVDGVALVPAVALGVGIGFAVGLINATVVVVMKIDSFIGTLATGSLLQALVTMITNDTPISDVRLSEGFAKIGQTTVGGINLPVLYFGVVAIGIWYLLEHTATGRRLYAVGFNPEAARLAGVKVARLQFMSLVTSGVLAGSAGIVLASILGGGSPTAGVDIGTRVAIYDLIAGLARDGLTVVVSSSDMGDLLAMCTRIVVLRDGHVAAELAAEGLTEHALVR